MLTCTVEEIMARIDALPRDMELSKALMSVLQGISPIIAREVENSAGLGHEVYVKSMTPPQRRRTEMYVTTLMETAKTFPARRILSSTRRINRKISRLWTFVSTAAR